MLDFFEEKKQLYFHVLHLFETHLPSGFLALLLFFNDIINIDSKYLYLLFIKNTSIFLFKKHRSVCLKPITMYSDSDTSLQLLKVLTFKEADKGKLGNFFFI